MGKSKRNDREIKKEKEKIKKKKIKAENEANGVGAVPEATGILAGDRSHRRVDEGKYVQKVTAIKAREGQS